MHNQDKNMQIDLSGVNVLVIGDIMLDAYYFGISQRSSPEANVPLIDIKNKEVRLGGAANVAANIKSLGSNPILLGACGVDTIGRSMLELLELQNISSKYVLTSSQRKSILKSRVLVNDKQVLRFDEEKIEYLKAEEELSIKKTFDYIIENETVDIIILQDYNKGLLTENLISHVISVALQRNIKIAVDPKVTNFDCYKDVTLLKPNYEEFCKAIGRKVDKTDLEQLIIAAKELCSEMNFKSLMVTLSECGIFCYDDQGAFISPAHLLDACDVCGAGDTVISIVSLAVAKHVNFNKISHLANKGAASVCKRIGVSVVSKLDLEYECEFELDKINMVSC